MFTTIKFSGSTFEDEIIRINSQFEVLVDTVKESFTEGIPQKRLQRSINHILAIMLLYFHKEASLIFKTEPVEQLFFFLSYYWDYLNPGLLEFIIRSFGSKGAIQELKQYLETLQIFRRSVKLHDFVKFAPHSESSVSRGKIILIMGDVWEQKTLQDVEELKIQLSGNCNLLQKFLTRVEVTLSAIIFYFPCQVQINMKEMEPFFEKNIVIKAFSDDYCWTRKVFVIICLDKLCQ